MEDVAFAYIERIDELEREVKELEEWVVALIRAGDRFVLEPVRWVDNKIDWQRVRAAARVAAVPRPPVG